VDRYPVRARLTASQVDDTFTEAFSLWAGVTSLVFVHETDRSQEVDISIQFASYQHGDADGFDGPGGTLAHAYFPQFGGDIHVDDSENWTVHSYKVRVRAVL
jgi:matrix metalloproteinase-14 (membrane-inserted)